jgi:HSP20 family protein
MEVKDMLLTTFDPFAEFDRLARGAFGPARGARVSPAVRMDAIRREHDVQLRFDLPGIDPASIDVTVDRGVLSVSAKRDEEYAEGEKPFIRERVMGSFTRRIRLADTVDADRIEAAFDAGVLTVTVPVAETAKPRKVEITSGAKAEITA